VSRSSRLPLPRVFAFAAGSIPVAMLMLITSTYLPRFYAGKVGIGLGVLGLAIASIRLADVGLDLALGWIMDRTDTRLGRFRPWYALALPILAFGAWKLLNPPPGADLAYLLTWLLIVYAGYSIAALSHAAWGATLSSDYHERARLFGWMQGIAVLGSVALLLAPVLTGGAIRPGAAASMPAISLIFIAASVVLFPVSLLFAPERVVRSRSPARAGLKDFAAVFRTPSMLRLVAADLLLTLGAGATAPLYIFFFHDAKGFSLEAVSLLLIPYVGAGLLGAPFWARIARALGKHRAVQVAALAYAVTQTLLMLTPGGLLLPTFAGMFAVGFCASAFVLLIRAMVGDVSDQLRLATGQEQSGVLFALVILTQKVGSSLTASIVLPILAAVGYDAAEGARNTPSAIFGLEMCYLFAPVALVLAGGSIFFGYRMTAARHAEIQQALAARERVSVGAAEESFAGPVEPLNVAAE
jgi:GPH family glycoside/pentoside/hexuronide:cation symporter